jgi:hypothetical protein
MDWRTFIAELLKTSAWPTVAIVGICVFRKEIKGLVAHLRKGRIGAAEFEFGADAPLDVAARHHDDETPEPATSGGNRASIANVGRAPTPLMMVEVPDLLSVEVFNGGLASTQQRWPSNKATLSNAASTFDQPSSLDG